MVPLAHAAGKRPDRGAEYAAAVKWKAGEQIEDGEAAVHEGKVLDEGLRGHVSWDECAQNQEDYGEEQAARRPHYGDEEFVSRPPWLGLERRGAAKDEEGNAVNLQAASQRHEGVGEFVEQHGTEEQYRSRAARQPVVEFRPSRIADRVDDARQRPGDQEEGQEPRVVQPHRDTRQTKERERSLVHTLTASIAPNPLVPLYRKLWIREGRLFQPAR